MSIKGYNKRRITIGGKRMPRPCKKRRVCAKPACAEFGPQGQEVKSEMILMSLDEYECIRLMDYEGFTQEQCALQMEVARTTVQAIYSSARKKMAECLVEGRDLRIDGGNYILCERHDNCYRRYSKRKGDKRIMKIGVTYENGQIFQHFGHTEQFKIYEVEDGKVVASEVIDTNGSGHGALAGFLLEHGVDVLICGGIGGGAQVALAQAGIRLFGGVSGDADVAVEALLKEELVYNPNVTCNHHGEGHHHEGGCGSHGCGSHGCH